MARKSKKRNRPLAFSETGLNRDTNLLKLIAMICMVIDHVGKTFFPQYHALRIIGRLSLPLYAYCVAVGCIYTRNHLKYLTRVVLICLISQPFYAEALSHTRPAMYRIAFRDNPIGAVVNYYVESWAYPNILFTLALGILVVWTIRENKPVLTVALALLIWKIQGSIDYGWRGIALIVLFYLSSARWWVALPVVLSFMTWWGTRGHSYQLFGVRFGIQMFTVAALPLILIHTNSGLKINKWVYYVFYPAHLIGILLIEMALKTV